MKYLKDGRNFREAQASYEATILAAILNARGNGNNMLFLTLLGGGAFGNPTDWIISAIQRALSLYKDVDLHVAVIRLWLVQAGGPAAR